MSQSPLTAEMVAHFLTENPQFFLEHEDLLLTLKLPHPRTNTVLSLAERQTFYLRKHNQQLERQLQVFLNLARENELIQQALWQWATELLSYQGKADTLIVFACSRLQAQYGFQEVQLRLWWDNSPYQTALLADSAKQYIKHLSKPYTGPVTPQTGKHWFEQTLSSMALIPLYAPTTPQCIGALALGSDKPQRFTPNMGTDFLQIMAQVIVAALARFYDHSIKVA